MVAAANLTIIFEDTYANWTARRNALADATQSYDHKKLALMLHSVPKLSQSDTEATVQKLLGIGQSIWLTRGQNYTQLDSYFPVFVDCLDGLHNQAK